MRYTVRRRDFDRGYVVIVAAAGRELPRTHNTHRAPVAALAARMNARIR